VAGLIANYRIELAALEKAQRALILGVLKAGTATIGEVTKGLERELEQKTQEKVGGRLWRAWKSDVYPRGSKPARDPVGQVYVNGGARSRGAIAFNTRPGRVQAKDGQFLAIPTAAAGARGRARDLTPGEWERRTGNRLRFVCRRGRPSLLVLDNATAGGKRGVARARSAKRQGPGQGSTVPIFVLVPLVPFANRFAIEPAVRRWSARIGPDLKGRVTALGKV
jgi:hypothetical protein